MLSVSQVRASAVTYLQRSLLVHDLQALAPAEWEACFHKVGSGRAIAVTAGWNVTVEEAGQNSTPCVFGNGWIEGCGRLQNFYNVFFVLCIFLQLSY